VPGTIPLRVARWTVHVPHSGVSDLRIVLQPDGRPAAWITRPVPGSTALRYEPLAVTED